MAAEKKSFNILEHTLVPKHILLSEEEAEKVLADLKLKREQLPKIRKNDAAIRALERTEGVEHSIEPGSVIKVVRKSKTAGIYVAYRGVVAGGEF